MKRMLFLLVGLLGVLARPDLAPAQVPFGQFPSPRPPVSPYLNLNRPGTDPAINYYGIVRPQLQFYGGIQSLQQDVAANQAAIATGFGTAQNLVPTTGVVANFMTESRFFFTRGGRSPGMRGAGGLSARSGQNTAPTGQPSMGAMPTTGATSTAGARPSYP
jgi:hypothetical protein